MKFQVSIGVLSSDLALQQLIYAHLLDVAPEADLDQVEVLVPPHETRLRHYFAPPEMEAIGLDAPLVLLLPGAKVPLAESAHLRVLGRFKGTITRALIPGD